MKFIVRNQAKISNKYIRFAKWKIRNLSSKFSDIIYSEIYVKKISQRPAIYQTVIKMGVPGPDIVVSSESENLNEMWSNLSAKMKASLRKHASRKK